MSIDFVTLLLINMTAGHFLLAFFLLKGIAQDKRKHWAPAFAAVGLIALAAGLHMAFTWPLQGSFNVAFGETSAFFGTVFLALAWAIARNWSLTPVGLYAVFGGLASVLVGARISSLGLTRSPTLAFAGFTLSGLAAVLLAPAVHWRRTGGLRALVAVVLIGAGLIWALVGYSALWAHIESFKDWQPATVAAPADEPQE